MELLGLGLESQGYKVLSYTQESAALRDAEQSAPTAILYKVEGDVNRRCASWVKCFHQTTKRPVIIITDEAPASFLELYRAGAEVVFQTPVVLYLLREALQESIQNADRNFRLSRSFRISTTLPVEIHSNGQPTIALTRNVSQTGMLVELPQTLSVPEDNVEFSLFLPTEGTYSIRGTGRVRHRIEQGAKGLGVEFNPFPSEAEERLAKYVNAIRTSV